MSNREAFKRTKQIGRYSPICSVWLTKSHHALRFSIGFGPRPAVPGTNALTFMWTVNWGKYARGFYLSFYLG